MSSTFPAFCGSGASSSSHFEAAAAPGQARAAIPSAKRARCRKRRQVRCFRARPSRVKPWSGLDNANVGRCGVFEPGRANSSGPQRSRAGSSGHLERPSGAERARAAISSAPAEPSGHFEPFRAICSPGAGFDDRCGVLRCFEQPRRAVKSWRVQAFVSLLRKFNIRYIC